MTKAERDARDAADFRLIEEKGIYVDPPFVTDNDATRSQWTAWRFGARGGTFERSASTLHAALNKLRKARGWK